MPLAPAVPRIEEPAQEVRMPSLKRLIVALTILGYGALPATSISCEYGPGFNCAARGESCNLFGGCCEGLECSVGTNTCQPPAVTDPEQPGDTAQNQR